MPDTAKYWIQNLKLKAHPEGGFYREVYRSGEFIQKKGLPQRYSSFRSFSTNIYFLLKGEQFSAFHRLKSDESWHFYKGSPLIIYMILQSGELYSVKLGPNLDKKELFQFVVPKGAWFAAKPLISNSYSLIGCTVSPGFDFDDFELAKRDALLKRFPEHQQVIRNFTRID